MEGKKIYLIGIGMGTPQTLTKQASVFIQECDLLIGAKRMLLPYFKQPNTQFFTAYEPKKIGTFLREEITFHQAAILLSGDVGFYSGAAGLLEELKDFDVELVPGISSLVYFCSRLQVPWQDVCVTSLHGQKVNLIQRILRHHRTFALLGGQEDFHTLCQKLLYYGMCDVKLFIGEQLGYEQEYIWQGGPEEGIKTRIQSLSVLLVENPNPQNYVYRQIPDEAFVRGAVPMTKSEVRTLSISKMQLTTDAVVYDIGAGTGSISIEVALQMPDIQVYAIEKNPEAVNLTRQNIQKFCADNVTLLAGEAPQILQNLPTPTHVFLGGTGGKIDEILAWLFEKNPSCRVVGNFISLDSIGELMHLLKEQPDYEADIVQIQTARVKELGNHHLMQGQNPIYIVTLTKK